MTRYAALAVSGLLALLSACARTTAPTASSSAGAVQFTRPSRAPAPTPTAFVPPAPPVTLSPKANAAEATFIRAAAGYLGTRYPNPQAAEADGYVRYTDEDQDGIITYTNQQWFGDDPQHPTQLWYDAHGRFLGADYTMPVKNRARRPDVWGLQPGRWAHFVAHMHYVIAAPSAKIRYGSMFNDDYRANGGDPNHPTAQPLVRARIAASPDDVKLIFQLPEIWIASVWLIPNPRGAFADSDPLVIPTQGVHQPSHPRPNRS
jgi:hypothetical protein